MIERYFVNGALTYVGVTRGFEIKVDLLLSYLLFII